VSAGLMRWNSSQNDLHMSGEKVVYAAHATSSKYAQNCIRGQFHKSSDQTEALS
jgi:hypothetical protein